MFDRMDPSRPLEIGISLAKSIRMLMGAVLMLLIAVIWLTSEGEGAPLIAWVAAVFAGAMALLVGWTMATMRGPVVTVTPEGIRDIRIAPEFIPWTAVENIAVRRHRRSNASAMMMLTVSQATLSSLTLTRAAKSSLAVGQPALCIAAGNLDVDFDRLLMTCAIYAEASRQGKAVAARA